MIYFTDIQLFLIKAGATYCSFCLLEPHMLCNMNERDRRLRFREQSGNIDVLIVG